MPFDKTQPADSTKIRNLGVVIRPNWTAIEEAEPSFKVFSMNFVDRSTLPAPTPVNPAAIADVYQLFCKKDSGGHPQLYVESPGGSVVKISTSVIPVSAQNGYSWLSGGLILQWGIHHANGTANTIIPFHTAFSGNAYNIQTTMTKSTGGSQFQVTVRNEAGHAPTNAQFEVYNPNSGHDIYWTAIGPKV